MRVDKWIWAVRMVKSRTLAGTMCKQGKVLINNEKIKSSKILKLDDIVTVNYKGISKVYKVIGFIPKRVSADLAAKNYEDLSPTPATKKDQNLVEFQQGQREKGEGRPTKKDRRDIDKFMGF
jgi:ribosome-associated heat shock protein Hsp15